ncbi:hypothetical protein F4859DRAFT_507002 [Xylaria cf. heliscus]|nr:hypothetical protein F4859DRAFT_507002 [Xylaria cf. heliscus]
MSAADVFLSLEKIEDHPSGYPPLACFIGLHPLFYISRRFSVKVIFRGTIIDQLETAIADYGTLLARTRKALNTRSAREGDVVNLRDWINSNGCLSREESKYLWKSDLISTLSDSVEDYIIWISNRIHKDLRTLHTRDPNRHILPKKLIRALTQVILALFASATALVPIRLFSLMKPESGRLDLIVTPIMIFVGVLSLVARPKVREIFIAGATFAAVVVVYMSTTDN